MDKFVTSISDEYYAEKDRRYAIYKNNCNISGDLWDKYEKTQTREDLRAFFDFFPNVDKSYFDWFDGVAYEYKDE